MSTNKTKRRVWEKWLIKGMVFKIYEVDHVDKDLPTYVVYKDSNKFDDEFETVAGAMRLILCFMED